jgi:ribosomal protein S18 acetylase RimI-like enzyme
MAKLTFNSENLTFRPAVPEDASVAGQLIFETFPKVATFLIGLGNEERAKTIITRLFGLPGHRFSYQVTRIAQYEGRIIGLMVVYGGKLHSKLDKKLDKLVLKQYRLRGRFALIARAWPLMWEKEVSRDEFLVGNLAVRNRYRGKGAGTVMLDRIEELAGAAGYSKVALRVAIENQSARKLYERVGYKTVAIHLEPNTRVRYMGAGYRRMVKKLSEK